MDRGTRRSPVPRSMPASVSSAARSRDRASGVRHNTALVFDAPGRPVARYVKVHLPDEPGFHEPYHDVPGAVLADVIPDFGFTLGIQICSDINRPEGSQLLAAHGAMAILSPRATEAATFDRWRLVFRANAMTGCTYVLSVNRPAPEQGSRRGGVCRRPRVPFLAPPPPPP